MSKLPYEIVDKIIDYCYDLHAMDKHKIKYSKIMDKIRIQSVLIKYDSIASTYILGWDSNLYNINDYKNMLDACNECKCCIRHQRYRPNINNARDGSYFKTTGIQNNKTGNKKYYTHCHCHCRSMSRMLCSLIKIILDRNDDPPKIMVNEYRLIE